jgi:uncharacterized membrane protein YhaH (DUF805 family)
MDTESSYIFLAFLVFVLIFVPVAYWLTMRRWRRVDESGADPRDHFYS